MKKLAVILGLLCTCLISGAQISGPYTPTTTVATVLVTSGQVIAANPTRRSLMIQNVGAYAITCTLGTTTAVVGSGIVLASSGTLASQGSSALFQLPSVNSAVQCISVTGTSYLVVIEGN